MGESYPSGTTPKGPYMSLRNNVENVIMIFMKSEKNSFYAVAWQDPQFQSEWTKDDSFWVCINWHIPLQNQQPSIITGKLDADYFHPVKTQNPNFDPKLQV